MRFKYSLQISNMAERRQLTKKERKEFIKERYFRMKTKLMILLSMLIVFLVLVYSLYFAIKEAIDPFLVLLLVVGIVVFIPIAIFFIDIVWHESD